MLLNKKSTLLLLFSLLLVLPVFGQRFTKKEQALREARAINYFYGHSFTFSTGYVHSWLTKDGIENLTIQGRSGAYQNTCEAFDFMFSWDICHKKHFGYQFSMGYLQNGGQKVIYQDNGFGYGPQLREDLSENIRTQNIEVQGAFRYFFPLTYKSRVSINAGAYIDKLIGGNELAHNWDLGVMVGVGYDWKCLSTSITYKPGVFSHIVRDSHSRQAALMFNVGIRVWK